MLTIVEEQSSEASPSDCDDPLLELRFELPRPPRQHVERRRLVSRLDEGADLPLTLVSAPAGSGKTTLVAAWVAARTSCEDIGWLTFEPGDESPERFWPLVVESLRRCGLSSLSEVAHAHGTDRRMLTELGAALSRSSRPRTLVLDGFEITDPELGAGLHFLLSHADNQLRLVLLTRADPAMPLHQLRLQDSMAELRMADLSFTEAETARLLELAEVSLSAGSVTTLLRRTRGWAVGLRFATMSLTKAEDPDQAVSRLAGDSGNIAEYLMTEMLETQPADGRKLLLRTSVVDVLQPGLLEELGGPSARRRLADLARANVLVEEVAGHPGWYRYHPLFRDVLRAEHSFAAPRRHRRLQRRAASWFASHGLVHKAVAMSAAASAWSDAAAHAIDGLAVGRLLSGEDGEGIGQVLRSMPVMTAGPAAAAVRAALALADDDPDRCSAELSRARRAVEEADSPVGAAVELSIDVVDAVRSRDVDGPAAETYADRAADRLEARTDDDSEVHVELATLIQTIRGVAQLRGGDIAGARETLRAAVQISRGADPTPLLVSTQAHLALAACLQGRLRQAGEWARRSVALADELAVPPGQRPPEVEIALGWICIERYDLSAAARHLKAAPTAWSTDPIARALAILVRARMARTAGELDKALTLLDGVGGLPADAAWLADLLALEAALVRGHAHAVRGEWSAVAESVAALAADSADGVPLAIAVEARLLEAAHQLRVGHERRARAALGRSLRMAAPECLRRPFHEAPAVVRDKLMADPQLLSQNAWLGAAFRPRSSGAPAPLGGPGVTGPSVEADLIDPLTAKEQEVLGHLAELLTTEEIAAVMFVSVNTVRTHVRSILRKLAVSRRNEAVRRARALRLIAA